MTKEHMETYKKLLFSKDLKTYAIVDGARGKETKQKMFETELTHCSLWHEEIEESTSKVPLYLVELKQEAKLLDFLLENHDAGLATYFQSPYKLESLKEYYSSFTYPQIEVEKNDFQKGIFGFYDPRILPNYLETLYSQEKVDEFFLGITLWLTPTVEDETLAHFAFRTKRGSFESVSLRLENFSNDENISLNFDNISFPTVENLGEYVQEQTIDHRQIEIFETLEIEKYVKAVFTEFEENNEDFMLNAIALEEKSIKFFYVEAKVLGFETEAGIYYYIWFCCLNEENFKNQEIENEIKSQGKEFKKINFLKKKIEEHKAEEN